MKTVDLSSAHYGLTTEGSKYDGNDGLSRTFPHRHSLISDFDRFQEDEFQQCFNPVDPHKTLQERVDGALELIDVIESDIDCEGIADVDERYSFLLPKEVARWCLPEFSKLNQELDRGEWEKGYNLDYGLFVKAAIEAKEGLLLYQRGL